MNNTFELVHVGINTPNPEEAEKLAQLLSLMFHLTPRHGQKSEFAGSYFECMKAPFLGVNGHVAMATPDLESAVEELKEKGLWFVCADMGGEQMYRLNLTGPVGLVVGNEGEGVSRLVKESCDFTAAIPMKGEIDSLNASVAAGVLAYEIVRQRLLT